MASIPTFVTLALTPGTILELSLIQAIPADMQTIDVPGDWTFRSSLWWRLVVRTDTTTLLLGTVTLSDLHNLLRKGLADPGGAEIVIMRDCTLSSGTGFFKLSDCTDSGASLALSIVPATLVPPPRTVLVARDTIAALLPILESLIGVSDPLPGNLLR